MNYDTLDVNEETQIGFTNLAGFVRDGLRCSTAKAFLRSVSHRKNLHVSTHSLAEKILVDKNTKTAYGVQFRRDGRKFRVHAKREVILSAGTIKSPQILMLSGIGPTKHLEEIGIPVIHDSPGVGENLQDHVCIEPLMYSVDMPPERPIRKKTVCKGSGTVSTSGAERFLIWKDGPMYKPYGIDGMAFVRTKYADTSLQAPDVQLSFDGMPDGVGAGFISEVFDKNTTVKKNYTVVPSVIRPKSRGYIKLRGADPDHYPVIVPNYFHNPHDLDALIEGAKMIHNFTQSLTMKRLNARPNFEPIAACAKFTFTSDDYWRCHARHNTVSKYHPSSSCKMGPASDAMAVVDSRLRVHGVKGIRVVDASIMPFIVSGNINDPTIMIAEKAADYIKEDHELAKAKKCNTSKSQFDLF